MILAVDTASPHPHPTPTPSLSHPPPSPLTTLPSPLTPHPHLSVPSASPLTLSLTPHPQPHPSPSTSPLTLSLTPHPHPGEAGDAGGCRGLQWLCGAAAGPKAGEPRADGGGWGVAASPSHVAREAGAREAGAREAHSAAARPPRGQGPGARGSSSRQGAATILAAQCRAWRGAWGVRLPGGVGGGGWGAVAHGEPAAAHYILTAGLPTRARPG